MFPPWQNHLERRTLTIAKTEWNRVPGPRAENRDRPEFVTEGTGRGSGQNRRAN